MVFHRRLQWLHASLLRTISSLKNGTDYRVVELELLPDGSGSFSPGCQTRC